MAKILFEQLMLFLSDALLNVRNIREKQKQLSTFSRINYLPSEQWKCIWHTRICHRKTFTQKSCVELSKKPSKMLYLLFKREKKGWQVTYNHHYIYTGVSSKLSATFVLAKAKCVTLIPFNFLNDSGDEPE